MSEGIRYLGRLQSDRFDIRIGGDVSEIVKTMTGNRDPYRKIKLDSNRMAEEWFSRRKTANVTFEYAVRLAAAANNIDYGALRTTQQPKALFERGG